MGRRKGNANDAPSPEWLAAIEGMQPEPVAEPEPKLPETVNVVVPALYTDFCEWLRLDPPLSLAQWVIGRVAYDGVDPCDLGPDHQELAQQLFGDVGRFGALVRAIIILVCGARGGKTSRLVALRVLHLGLTVDLSSLAEGETAIGMIVAPDMREAKQTISFVKGAIDSSHALLSMVEGRTTTTISMLRPDGKKISIECIPASAGGDAQVGRTLFAAVMDEAARFRDPDTGVVNDQEIYRAMAPRLLPGGQAILASTPRARVGLLYAFHERNHGHPVDALSVHAPTLLLNPGKAEQVEREFLRDPYNARNEFNAEWLAKGTDVLLDPRDVDDATRRIVDGKPGIVSWNQMASCGIDLAFKNDSCSCVVTERQGPAVAVVYVDFTTPDVGRPLKPSVVAKSYALAARIHGCRELVADGWYIETAREHGSVLGVAIIEGPSVTGETAESFIYLRYLFREHLIDIPDDPRLIEQLKSILATPIAGGKLQIKLPRTASGHADGVSALVNACWMDRRFGPVGTSDMVQQVPCSLASSWEQW